MSIYLLESKIPQNLYFLSENNMDHKVLVPRIPDNFMTKNGYEDNKTKRVCFAPTIDQCLMGLSMNLTNKQFFVHTIDPSISRKELEKIIYYPTKKQVPDVKITGEIWILKPIQIICIGKIKVIKDAGEPGIPYTYGNYTAELYEWIWEWKERYNSKEV